VTNYPRTVDLVEELIQSDSAKRSPDLLFIAVTGVCGDTKLPCFVEFFKDLWDISDGLHPGPIEHRSLEPTENAHQCVPPVEEDESVVSSQT
jgi:hypothetical protein